MAWTDIFAQPMRLLALFFALSGLTLSIAALANNHWLDFYDWSRNVYIAQSGLFQSCYPQYRVFNPLIPPHFTSTLVTSQYPWGFPNGVDPGSPFDPTDPTNDFEECALYDRIDFCTWVWFVQQVQASEPGGTDSSHPVVPTSLPNRQCQEWQSVVASRAFSVLHTAFIGLATVGLIELYAVNFGALRTVIIILEAFAVIFGVICTGAIYGLRNELITDFEDQNSNEAYISARYTNGAILFIVAWICSFCALVLTLFVPKPAKNAEERKIELTATPSSS